LRSAPYASGGVHADVPATHRSPWPRNREPFRRTDALGVAVDRDVALQPVPAGGELGDRELERYEEIEVGRDVERHGIQSDRQATPPGDLADACGVDPHLVGIAISASEHECSLHRGGEPFEARAD